MLTLHRCACGRYRRYGRGTFPRELCGEERKLLEDSVERGMCVVVPWICPYCEGIVEEHRTDVYEEVLKDKVRKKGLYISVTRTWHFVWEDLFKRLFGGKHEGK